MAGPTFITSAQRAENLYQIVNERLNWYTRQILHLGIVSAVDTITGRLALDWADKKGVPFYGHKAFDNFDDRLTGSLYSARARELIIARNDAMMGDRRLFKALLFIQSNEMPQFIDGLRRHENDVEIMRVCA